MRRLWLVLIALAACSPEPAPSPTVELIASTTASIASTVPPSTAPPTASTTAVPATFPDPVITLAPPLVTAATNPPTTRPPTIPTSPPITIAPEIAVVFSAPSEALLTASTNLVRTSIGLPELIHHADLDFYARVWAGHLSIAGVLGHSDIATLLGPWLIVGENVAAGTDMGQVANALATSPDHYATMVGPAYFHTGVGVAVDPAGRLWVCQVFGGTVLP